MHDEDKKAVLLRLRRKIEILRLEYRRANNTRWHDMDDMLRLVEMLERDSA